VLYGVFLVDAAGIPYDGDYAITQLRASTSVPMFGFLSAEMGKGVVGGALVSTSEQGVIGAKVASRLMRGENPKIQRGMQKRNKDQPKNNNETNTFP